MNDTSPDTGTLKLEDLPTLIRDFVDELLPGNGAWPSGGTIGVQATLVMRLADIQGEETTVRLGTFLLAAGAPFEGKGPEARAAIVRTFEIAEPSRFTWLYDTAMLAYYENPLVVKLIAAGGHPYRLRPHRNGYALPRFDRARQTPRHNRGHYVQTEEVRPVDVSSLDLDGTLTTNWGKSR